MERELKREETERKNIYDYEIERRVIAKMMTDGEAGLNADVAINWLMPDYFYDATFRELFKCMVKLRNENKPVDILTVRNEILNLTSNPEVKNKFITDVDAASFYRDLNEYSSFSSDLKNDCDIIYDKYLTRSIKAKCEEVIKKCHDPNYNSESILTEAQSEFFNMNQHRENIDFADNKEVLKEILTRINKASQTPDGITGVRTGFSALDKKTSGLQNGNLIILAARPSIGKTSFAVNIAYNAAKKGKKVAMFSLEMSASELLSKLISIDAPVSGEKMRSGKLTINDLELMVGGADVQEGSLNRIYNLDIKINDTARTAIDIKNKCMKLKSENKLDLVIIDYLQLMTGNVDKNSGLRGFNNRQEEVSGISRSLKLLAKELNVPLIALSQVNRDADGSEPRLSELRESGAIEQDADIVMFLHNENKANGKNASKMDIPKDKIKLIIAKHRNGEVGSLDLRFDETTTKFTDY